MGKVSYGIRILNITDGLEPTLRIYRAVIRYLVDIAFLHYEDICRFSTLHKDSAARQDILSVSVSVL